MTVSVPDLIKNNVPLFSLALLIVLLTLIPSDCQQKWKNEEDMEISYRNEKILNVCKGIGYGILTFLLLGGLIGERYFLGLGLILCIFAIININSYLSLSRECQEGVHSNYNLMYALIGAGVGMMVYSLISQADKMFSLSSKSFFMENKGKLLMMFANIIVILMGSLTLDNNNRCLNQNGNSPHKIVSIIFITLAVISSVVILFGRMSKKAYSKVYSKVATRMKSRRLSRKNKSKLADVPLDDLSANGYRKRNSKLKSKSSKRPVYDINGLPYAYPLKR
jgi:hypothetical protein